MYHMWLHLYDMKCTVKESAPRHKEGVSIWEEENATSTSKTLTEITETPVDSNGLSPRV